MSGSQRSRPDGDGACAGFAELRSALVDGALGDADRERMLRHLVDCAECRDEVEALRQVRDLLRSSAQDPGERPADGGIADRLIAIGGADAQRPLYSRPFDRPAPPRRPPSDRGARRRRITGATMVLGLVGLAFAGAGWVAAPKAQAAIDDPAAGSVAEMSATLTQFPLSSPPITAALASGAELPAEAGPAPEPAPAASPRQLDRAAAVEVLWRAIEASGQVGHRGTAHVSLTTDRHRVGARVDVVAQARQGMHLTVRSRTGTVLSEGVLPVTTTSTRVSLGQSDWPMSDARLTATAGATVAGRATTAVTAGGTAGVERTWWIDDETGLVLWQVTRDAEGRVLSSAGFTEVTISDQPFVGHRAPRLMVPATTASLTLGSAGVLSRTGWYCAEGLDGMQLVRLRADSQTSPGMVQSVYSDGVSTVSVMQQRGRLADELPGYTRTDRDPIAGEEQPDGEGPMWYRDTTAVRTASWQSGGTVITVVTDGPHALLAEVVDQLPRGDYQPDSRLDRVRAGWARIYELVVR